MNLQMFVGLMMLFVCRSGAGDVDAEPRFVG